MDPKFNPNSCPRILSRRVVKIPFPASWVLFFGCALFVFCAAFFTAGCGSDPRLTIMLGGAPREISEWEEVLADFQAKTGVRVEIMRSTTDTGARKQALLLALRGRCSDPDLLLVDVGWIGQFAASRWLEPLGSLGIATEPFFPAIIQRADTWEGRPIGVPLYVDGGLLYYRKDLLEKHGFASPPTTWEELASMAGVVQAGERSSDPNFWGFVWQGAQYEGLSCVALEFMSSAGGGFQGEGAALSLFGHANERAWTFMADLVNRFKVSPPNTFTEMKEEEVRLHFQNGHALFERNWPYAWSLHQAADSPVRGKVGMVPLPAFPGGSPASTLGGWHLAISRFSDRPTEAAKLLSWLVSAETQRRFAINLGWNPGRMDLYDDPELGKVRPGLSALREAFERAVPRPGVPQYSELSAILQKHLNAALAGRITPAEALIRADREFQAVGKAYEN